MKTTQYTSIKAIKNAFEFFKSNPHGEISTGIWSDPLWNKEKFIRYFRNSLQNKINRGETRNWKKLSDEYQSKLKADARRINDYARCRVLTMGRNILNTPEMKKRYPYLDNPMTYEA